MNRPDFKLLLGIVAICIFAVMVTGCGEHTSSSLFGGIAFDLAGAAIHGLAGN